MLELYYQDIKKYGNDPRSVGVDEILKNYSSKYAEYETLGKAWISCKITKPGSAISFTYRNRKGIEEAIAGTMEEVLQDERIIAYACHNYQGMDPEIYSEVAKLGGPFSLIRTTPPNSRGISRSTKPYRTTFPPTSLPEMPSLASPGRLIPIKNPGIADASDP